MITKEEKDFIISFEGFSAKAYQLKGENFYTIGYGTARTYKDGTPIKKDDIITKDKAEEELEYYYNKNIAPIITEIETAKKQCLTPQQKMAICSLIYNCGKSSFCKSKCYKAICTGADCEAMKQWDFGMYSVADNMKKGIKKRRNNEIELFFGVKDYWK